MELLRLLLVGGLGGHEPVVWGSERLMWGSEVNFANNGIWRPEMWGLWPPSPPTLVEHCSGERMMDKKLMILVVLFIINSCRFFFQLFPLVVVLYTLACIVPVVFLVILYLHKTIN